MEQASQTHADRTGALVTRANVALSCAGAHVALDAAERRAAAIGVPECIAVVDAAGQLLAFSRMDGARAASIEIAITKARSAARRLRATADELGGDVGATTRLALASQNQVTGIGGGIPIVVETQTIGAIGVSSGTSDEDIDVGRAGIDALLAALGT